MAGPGRPGGYSDPAMAAAFQNVADIFAPPSGADLYGYTRAASEKAKAQRLSDFFTSRNTMTQDEYDRTAGALGLGTPSTGYYGVNTKADTDRRHQDIQSNDNRYNVDSRDSTSRLNNTDDNKRHMDVAMIAPVAKDATRFVPQSVADMYPGTPPMQTGVVAAQPGEKNYLPDGRVLEGNPKPLTESEMKAKITAGMSPEEQRAIAFGSTPIEDVIIGGEKKPMTHPQRLAAGAPSIPKEPTQAFNYLMPDGKGGGTAVLRDGKFVDSQTGAELPQGIRAQSTSAAQGSDGALGATKANITESNRKAANLDVMDSALNQYEDLLKKNPGVVGIPGSVRGVAQNAVSAAQEFAAAFGNVAPEAKIGADQITALGSKVGANHRDPAIAQARIMQADLAYKWAQMQNPTGEVSRQAFERAVEALTGGTLANNQSALEALGAVRETVKRERGGVNSLRTPTDKPTPAPGPTPTPNGPTATGPNGQKVMLKDGAWVPVQ